VSGKRLFLESCLINLLATTIAAATLVASQSQTQGLSIIAKIIIGVIGLVFVLASIYATSVCWWIDDGADTRKMEHAANNVSFAGNQCPYIGLLGSVTGIFVFMSSTLGSSADMERAKQVSMTGIGIALVPTIVGIFALIFLSWQHHIILQSIEEPST
jgi:hypothetical protein